MLCFVEFYGIKYLNILRLDIGTRFILSQSYVNAALQLSRRLPPLLKYLESAYSHHHHAISDRIFPHHVYSCIMR